MRPPNCHIAARSGASSSRISTLVSGSNDEAPNTRITRLPELNSVSNERWIQIGTLPPPIVKVTSGFGGVGRVEHQHIAVRRDAARSRAPRPRPAARRSRPGRVCRLGSRAAPRSRYAPPPCDLRNRSCGSARPTARRSALRPASRRRSSATEGVRTGCVGTLPSLHQPRRASRRTSRLVRGANNVGV